MAIKVIKKQKNSHRTRCGNCGVELEYLISDTYQAYVAAEDSGNLRMQRFLGCPECNRDIPVGNY